MKSLKSLYRHRYDLLQYYAAVDQRGGKTLCKDLHNRCRRETRYAKKNGERFLPSADLQAVSSLYKSMIDKESHLAKVEASSPSENMITINQFGDNHLFFNHNGKVMEGNGRAIKYPNHPNNNNKKSPQMTEEILAQLSEPPIIDENSNALTKILFPNRTINYVFHARRDGKCEALSQLHHYL